MTARDNRPPEPPAPRGPAADKPAAGNGAATAAIVASMLAAVYAVEGGYVNHPADPGGATRYGVTEAVARQRGYTGNMRAFPMHCTQPASICADKVYTRDYIERPGYMPLVAIEPAVAGELVDTTVNMGPLRPSSWFQQSLGEMGVPVAVDGRLGPQSIAGYRAVQARFGRVAACVAMLDRLDAKQKAEYGRLVARNPKLKVFYRGWIANRIGNVDRGDCGKGWE